MVPLNSEIFSQTRNQVKEHKHFWKKIWTLKDLIIPVIFIPPYLIPSTVCRKFYNESHFTYIWKWK